MNRFQLEHLLRACGDIAGDVEIVVIGSQSVLASIDSPPAVLAMSMEADLYVVGQPQLTQDIEGSLGEFSLFHDTHGFYAQAVSEKTAFLPSSWRLRAHEILVPLKSGRVTARCLDPHDLALSKFAAGREKDLDFNRALIAHGAVDRALLEELANQMPVPDEVRELIRARIIRCYSEPVPG